ncbi:ribonuclease R [Fundidesulfovibrio agrisoli]|uniref:ribonuclease R n=1 Tax=Fundidesulfovibrio agrisoli TaxID=2922717 RepID=UPI001FAC0F4A|nr:ribonuclease R [Fundidesulfovibrio agrisoli]
MGNRPGKKGRKQGQPAIDQTEVLRLFRRNGTPMTLKDVLAGLGAPKLHKAQVQHLLEKLTGEGKLIRLQGAWGLAGNMRLVTGRLEVQRSGVGYLICDDKRRKDVFINPRDFGEAWHGDRVAAALTRQRGDKSEGRIVRILERPAAVLPCRVERPLRGGLLLCKPTDPRHTHAMLLEPEEGPGAPKPGDVLTLKAGDQIDHQLYSGEVVENLGSESDIAVQERLVKLNHGVPGPFPNACLEQAATLPPAPGEADFQGRRDMRAMGFVTIDGEKARDFDDAILVERDGKGYRLYVAIADVAHYVPQDSPLDREAQERGNSYYFPQSVEPMFPEALSNGLCSLNPAVPRLAMVVETDFRADGQHGESRFYPAVIESHARLTYTQVNRALLDKDEAVRAEIAPVLPMLETAETLARAINRLRAERGSLDFDLPEPEILFNLQGEAVGIRPRERQFGNQIIEEFMIAANEAVARFLTEHGAPVPYRVHPEPDPDKLQTLFTILQRSDITLVLPKQPTPKGLQDLLRQAHGTEMEFLASRLMLRAMMQARYSIANMGHYGLASECYCHFTSPIRRYADLMVHRGLKAVLEGRQPPLKAGKMQAACEHISQRERVAMDAEREILKRATVLFLRDKVGGVFDGVVSSLSDFGFWVELTELMAEGLVRLSTLTDDYYALFPERQELLGQHTGRRFRLGQHVRVELTDVELGRLEVNLRLADGENGERGGRPGLPRRQAAKAVKAGRSARQAKEAKAGGKRQDKSGKPRRPKR